MHSIKMHFHIKYVWRSNNRVHAGHEGQFAIVSHYRAIEYGKTALRPGLFLVVNMHRAYRNDRN